MTKFPIENGPGVDWAIATTIFLAIISLEITGLGFLFRSNRIMFDEIKTMLHKRMDKDAEQDEFMRKLDKRVYRIELKLGIENGKDEE